MSYALYQDPMQSQPMVIPQTGIGMRMVPNRFSLADPVFLRHVLCSMNAVRNMFHVYLCWRQLRFCTKKTHPPAELASAMPLSVFNVAKAEEMFAVEYMMHGYLFDIILSSLEMYFAVLPFLWKMVIETYSIVDDLIWQSIAFMALFAFFMLLRRLPLIIYSKFLLEPLYGGHPDKSLPIVGILCSFALLLVLLQVALVPFTVILLLIENMHTIFFLLSVWGLLFVMSIVAIILCCIYGLPMIGKKMKLPPSDLQRALTPLLNDFKFTTHNIYVIKTFQVLPGTAYAWKCCCFSRLFILDYLIWDLGKPRSELFPDEIGKGLGIKELVAYVARELIRCKFHHVYKAMAVIHATLIIYFVLFGTVYHNSTLYEAAGFSADYYPAIAGYWLVYKYVMPLYLTFTNWIIFWYLQTLEYSGDYEVWRIGYGDRYIIALDKMFQDNPIFPYVDSWYMKWHRYRPTTISRILRLREYTRAGTVMADDVI